MAYEKENILFNNFGGLLTSIADPKANSLRDSRNLTLNKVSGLLENSNGYASKYVLPVLTDPLLKISNVVWENIHTFTVREHDGRTINVAVGRYRKTSQYDPTVYIDRMCVFINPYWNGVTWVDDWIDVTDIEILKISSFEGVDEIRFSTNVFTTADKFKNWIGVFTDYSEAEDHDNYVLITESGNTGSHDYVKFFGLNVNLDRLVNDKMILVRSFLGSELPSTIDTGIFSLKSEMRLTTGNTATDHILNVGLRNKTFGWDTPDKVRDEIAVSPACLELWRYAVKNSHLSGVNESDDPISVGDLYMKYTLKDDNGNETELLTDPAKEFDITHAKDLLAGGTKRICTDGTYIYAIILSDGDYSIKKYDNTLAELASYDLDVGDTADYGLLYHDGHIFVSHTDSVSRRYVSKINSTTMVFVLKDEFVRDWSCRQIITDGTYLYLNFGYDIIQVAPLDLAIIDNLEYSVTNEVLSLCSDGTYLYAAVHKSPPSSLSDLKKIDVSTMTEIASAETPGIVGGTDSLLTYAFGKLWLPTTNYVYRVSTSLTVEDSVALVSPEAITYDGMYLYVLSYPGTGGTSIITLHPTTMEATTYEILSNTNPYSSVSVSDYLYFLFLDGTITKAYKYKESAYFYLDGNKKLQFSLYVSPTIPITAKSIRIYVSRDNSTFYYVKEISLLSGGPAWEAAPYYDATSKHFYHQTVTLELLGIDVDSDTPEASTQIGRSVADNGVIRYKRAQVVGETVYAIGVLDNEFKYKNTVFTSTTDGDGNQQPDIFPNNAFSTINLEYSDGDEILAIGNVNERIIFIKKRSVVSVVKDRYLGYVRDLVTRNFGICSPRSLVSYDDSLIWADYSGIIRYSTRGIEIINYVWLQDWLNFSIATKEAAVGFVDQLHHQYRLAVNNLEYVLDLNTNEWMIEDFYNQPGRYALSGDGTILFLSGATIFEHGSGSLHDGNDISLAADFNDLYPHHILGAKGQIYDINVERIILALDCDMTVSYAVYKNLDAIPSHTGTIAKEIKRKIIEMPNCRCNSLRLRLTATAGLAGHRFKLIRLGYAVAAEPIYGDITKLPV